MQREHFTTRLGFVLAAAGAAVGLGNVWGFPTRTAENGGAVFLVVYLPITFLLAYPVLLTELVLGRHGQANPLDALRSAGTGARSRLLGTVVGTICLLATVLILGFYSIIAGWMLAYLLEPLARATGSAATAAWLADMGVARNLVFAAAFSALTAGVIVHGVRAGIERWARRLMPSLVVLMIAMSVYVLTLDGAGRGLSAYLVPDLEALTRPRLILAAMGQAFFSLSIGAGTMMVYGSYLRREESLPRLAAYITIFDVAIALLAGLLILPAMYAAQAFGVPIFDASGHLLAEDALIFRVLPALFEHIGAAGIPLAMAFFALLSIAALTSTIATMEVPVSFVVEKTGYPRRAVTWTVAGGVFVLSAAIIADFERLFGATVALVTEYALPLTGTLFCVFVGWVWHRDKALRELAAHRPAASDVQRLLRLWPGYVAVVCPLAVLAVFAQAIWGNH